MDSVELKGQYNQSEALEILFKFNFTNHIKGKNSENTYIGVSWELKRQSVV